MQDEGTLERGFQEWMRAYGAAYGVGSAEYYQRLAVYRENLLRILRINLKFALAYYLSENAFADRTRGEAVLLSRFVFSLSNPAVSIFLNFPKRYAA